MDLNKLKIKLSFLEANIHILKQVYLIFIFNAYSGSMYMCMCSNVALFLIREWNDVSLIV